MVDPGLVAMLSVDEHWAKEVKKPRWEHPDPNLLERLVEKTQGRIIRMDKIPAGAEAPAKPDNTPQETWDAFIPNLNWDHTNSLWIEYSVSD